MSQVEQTPDVKPARETGVLHLVVGAVQLSAAVQRREAWALLPNIAIEPGVNAPTATSALAPEQASTLLAAATAPSAPGAVAVPTTVLGQLLAALTQLRVDLPAGITEVRVLVADGWLNTTSLLWSSDLRRGTTAELQARVALMTSGCEPAVGDLVRIDDAPYGALRRVVSYPVTLLEALRQLADGCGARLSSVRPMSAAAWAAGRGQGGRATGGVTAMGLCTKGSVTVLTGGRWLTEVHAQTVAGNLPPWPAMQRLWARLQLRDAALAGLPTLPVLDLDLEDTPVARPPTSPPEANAVPGIGASVEVRSGLTMMAPLRSAQTAALPGVFWLAQVPLARTAALDAVPAGMSRGWRAWWPAAAAALAAITFSVGAWQSFGAVTAARAQLAASQRAAVPVSISAPVWTREELARVRAVNQAVRELNLPIDALLAALQPPRDLPVSVLGVDVGGSSDGGVAGASTGLSTLRLQAEAGNAIDMTRYVAFVGDRRPMVGAYLVRHEVVASPDAERRYRFTVEVTWRD
ncbi:hypothetical protein SAMN05216359_111109 [Roseateles sp. YR242]|uniref:hypothetical protein n=1 Tax=Roseateles sp. YR242 TaxID=1855305 RepID=UPI0008BF6EFB|nr:hypothetical protein [Roseateles sp. YR242]SEL57558.1 hypothetical protein SAMN05216359_111109 [Roseateles sp. YR242]